MLKFLIYLPKETLPSMIDLITKKGGGVIGNYSGCMSYWPVTSTWISGENATPYSGEAGKRSVEEEYILQVRVPEDKAKELYDAICALHPYEEPVIDVVRLLAPEDLW